MMVMESSYANTIEWASVRAVFQDLALTQAEMMRDKGFWDENPNVPEMLCLVHSEITEALEEYRANHPLTAIRMGEGSKPEGFGVELADAVLRIAHIAGRFGINLTEAIKMKLAYNATRPHKHGGKRC